MGTPVSWILCRRCKEPVKAEEAALTRCLEEYDGEEAEDRPSHVIYVHRRCLHDGEAFDDAPPPISWLPP